VKAACPLPAASGARRERCTDVTNPPRTRLPAVEVTDIEESVDEVSFRVSKPGVPVLVKESYFPNWKAHGAHGPYRIAPNLMVVVPTQRDVSLTYETTGPEWMGRLLTLAGLVLLVVLARWRPPRDRTALGGATPTGGSIRMDAEVAEPPAELSESSPPVGDPALP
jgi:hypothetical protein